MMPKVWFYLIFWHSYEWVYVHTLETLNSRKTHWKLVDSSGWYEMQLP